MSMTLPDYSAAPNTILLKGNLGDLYEEAIAYSTIYPGMLIEMRSDGQVQPHSVAGGKARRIFAIEDALAGYKVLSTPYAAGDLVRFIGCDGDELIRGAIKVGQNVVKGDYLVSAGDGTLVKATSIFLADAVADSTTITNTTTETTFSTGSVVLAANTLKVGDVIRIVGYGSCPATNSTNTLTIKVKIGSTILTATAATDVADNDVFTFEVLATIRTIGASGTIIANGETAIGAAGTATKRPYILASTAIDTTATQTIAVTATWSVASASNQVVLSQFQVNQQKNGNTSNTGDSGFSVGTMGEAVDLSAASTFGLARVWVS